MAVAAPASLPERVAELRQIADQVAALFLDLDLRLRALEQELRTADADLYRENRRMNRA